MALKVATAPAAAPLFVQKPAPQKQLQVHQPYGGIIQAVQGMPNNRASAPQLPSWGVGVQNPGADYSIQPQPSAPQNLVGGFGQRVYNGGVDVRALVDAYNQSHQPIMLPETPYHDLSKQQKPAPMFEPVHPMYAAKTVWGMVRHPSRIF